MNRKRRVSILAAAAVIGLGAVNFSFGPTTEAYSKNDKVKVIYSGPHWNWNFLAAINCGNANGVEIVTVGDCVMKVDYGSCTPVGNGDGTWDCECRGEILSANPACEGMTGDIHL